MNVLNGILNFVKKHLTAFIYGSVGLVTVILATVLLVWTVNGEKARLSEIRPAILVCGEDVQKEYLVGQKFNSAGLSLNIGTEKKPDIKDISECTVNADFTSSGKRTVEVVYKADDYISYRAELETNVIFVRGMEIAEYPKVITAEGDGAFTADDNFEMYATLATKPESGAFGDVEQVANGYRIRIDEDEYTASYVADSQLKDFYTVTYYCGDVSATFSFYNAAGRSFIVSSVKDIVAFGAEEGAKENMTLVVTRRDENYKLSCTGRSEGYYIYSDAEGAQKLYGFDYELTDTSEVFKSEDVEESAGKASYSVVAEGHTFTADAALWQSAVVGGNIIDDHGYKLVVDSARRVLSFTYDSETDANGDKTVKEDNLPTLTLYVTEYDMNPLLGTGNGFSRGIYIYTDGNGYSYKTTFYMQAWVWTYVPLSSSHGDVYSDVSVSDYVYNETAPDEHKYNSYYRGTLYANITAFSRGEGFKTVTFTADETLWLGALLNM